MNERIQKLAQQAGFMIWKDEEWNPGDVIDWGSRYDNELEKFAELLVRECLEQIDEIRDGCEKDNEHQQALGADWSGLAVARHFGVSE